MKLTAHDIETQMNGIDYRDLPEANLLDLYRKLEAIVPHTDAAGVEAIRRQQGRINAEFKRSNRCA